MKRRFLDIIKRETYNPNAFSELNHLDDTHRLIAVSEGRSQKYRMASLFTTINEKITRQTKQSKQQYKRAALMMV